MLAGDGGVDDPESDGNGIVCSGDTAADNPLCTEQFENSQIASLKVVPEAGHGFTGWIINGAHITLTSAEPLFLSTMSLLAGDGPFTQCTQETEAQASCPMVGIDTDSNNDGTIDAQDELVEETSRKMIDYQDTTARVPVQLLAEALDNLDDTFSLEIAASHGENHLLAWDSESATEPLTLPASYALDALPSALFVSGCKTSDCGPGEAALELRLVQQQNGATNIALSDRVLFTVMDMAHIGGEFRIIGSENQAEYEMELTEEPDGIETFFRTLGGMRLHLQAFVLPEIEVEEYSWSSDQGKFLGSYEMTAAELTGDALKGAELTDMYWEGEYTPNLDVTVTLSLKIQGDTTPHSVTRKIKSRELNSGTEGNDVKMLQAFLRIIGLSEVSKPGYRGTPVTIDGDFGPKTKKALSRMQNRDQITDNGIVDHTTLLKVQRHWIDYLSAFEAFPGDPNVTVNHPSFPNWLQVGANVLAQTYTDAIQNTVDPNTSQEELLDAWVKQENRGFGHWGHNVDYRMTLGGWDEYGSIGFSQILNKYKYGSSPASILNDVNLYHPEDAVKAVAIWADEPFLKMAFVGSPPPFKKTKNYSANEYPRIGNNYIDGNKDLLSKGIMGYNHGTTVYYFTWPEMLKNFNYPKTKPFDARWGIKYTLEVQNRAGIPLKSWTWTARRITTGGNGKCETTASGDDVQVVPSGQEGAPNQVAITPGNNCTIDTALAGDDQLEVFQFTYSEEEWLSGDKTWIEKLLEEALQN